MSYSKKSSTGLWRSYLSLLMNGGDISADIVDWATLRQLKKLHGKCPFSCYALLALLKPKNAEKLEWAITASVPLSTVLLEKGTNEQLEIAYHFFKTQQNGTLFVQKLAEHRIDFFFYLIEKGEASFDSFELNVLMSNKREALLLKYIDSNKSCLPFSHAVECHLFDSDMDVLKSAYIDALKKIINERELSDDELTSQVLTLMVRTTLFPTLKEAFSRCKLDVCDCVDILVEANLPNLTARFIQEDCFLSAFRVPQIIEQLISNNYLDEFKKIISPDCLDEECERVLVNSGNETFVRAYLEAMKAHNFGGFDDGPEEIFSKKYSEEIKASYVDMFGLSYRQEYLLVHQGTDEMVMCYITNFKLFSFVEAFFIKGATSEELIEFYLANYFLDTPAEIALMRYRNPRLIAIYCQKLLTSFADDHDRNFLSIEAWPYFIKRGDDELILELIKSYRKVSTSRLPKDLDMLILETGRMSLIERYRKLFDFSDSLLESFIKKGTPQAVKTFVSNTKLPSRLEGVLVRRGDREICLAYVQHFQMSDSAVLSILDII